MLWKRLDGRRIFRTIPTSDYVFAEIASKASTRVYCYITSSDIVDCELLFSNCLANVSARNGIDSAAKVWSLSHPTNQRCCSNRRNARLVGMVSLQAPKGTFPGLLNPEVISCSQPVVFCSGRNNFLYSDSGR